MSSISSNPEVLDLIDDHLQGQLWEDVKEFISANPDILDRLDRHTLAGLVDWLKKKGKAAYDYAKDKATKAADYIREKLKKKTKEGDETSEEESEENQPAAATASNHFGASIRGCRTVSPADLTHLKLTIMQDPDVLDDMNAHLRDGLWQAMKGVIAADPALIHHLPCMSGKWMDKIRNAGSAVVGGIKKATKHANNLIHKDPHGLRNMSTEEIKALTKQRQEETEANLAKHNARREAERAIQDLKNSKKYMRSPFQPCPYDTIGIRVPVYGGDGRLSSSMLDRYAMH
ncbi:hypothetical protein GUITHDRAFT_119033 [Guillardia theta CCMP2712]|uniref:Uncharacterized protein n=1 Tax=Guillardia theta (strain CCMP2712) TaxID=905079 RepID=L1IF53_GUITC|nr:hypothetical protein GUITHDRAFT_119033 [Guillardia theta CCMP2712]EKX34848.1 hypothetical protein GUITHDRAFT_119033 [Guillardia theta CCMP2712]|eukprot:XP_005821828.1 hypothetical protein GUITHDRAFT_119033 [Guillardia theta CCMP2712]